MEHHEIVTYRYQITGIDCADCAARLERKIAQIEGISNVSLSFLNSTLLYDCSHDDGKRIEEEVRTIAAKEEPDAVITAKGHRHHRHEHEHSHEEETATYKFEITGIDCADCAAKLEGKIAQIEGISNVSLSFLHNSLSYDCAHEEGKRIEEEVRAVAAKEEPDAVIVSKGHSHHHEHEHEHSHEETAAYKFEITGIDCADCAAKLEGKIAQIEGISNVSLSFLHNSLSYDCAHDEGKRIEEEVRAVAAKEEPDAVIVSKGHSHHRHEHEHSHEETAAYKFEITGIDCADCAAKLERKIAQIEGISNVSLSFLHNSLSYDCAHDEGKRIEEEVRAIAAKEEPDAVIVSKGHSHHHEQEDPVPAVVTERTRKYHAVGIDCADCAAKLEGKVARIDGIENVHISFMNSTLLFECDDADLERIEKEIIEVFAKEEPDARVSRFESSPVRRRERKAITEEKEDNSMLYRLILGAVLFVAGLFLQGTAQMLVSIAAYLVLGWDVLYKALRGIGRGQLFDEHFLMAVATLAAMYLRDFREAAGVMLFYQIGEYFQDMAVDRSRKSIGELMDIRPDTAVVKHYGEWVETDPEDVRVDEVISIRPGERIPLDGIVLKGSSSLDTSSLTGESKPRDVDPGDEVISGSVNETGLLEIRVTKEYGDSTVARILDLIENQESRKSSHENFITKFSRVYTPAVVFSAIAVAVIVALLGYGAEEGIRRACTFLVISCPCALVISIPLSFFAGIGGLSSRGILVKGANLIEPLANVEQVVLDKTGTLTSGRFAVADMRCTDGRKESLLEDAAYAEAFSGHPIALGIREAYGKEPDKGLISDVKEIAGRGTSVTVKGHEILAGNARLMRDRGIVIPGEEPAGTVVHVAKDGVYEGCLILKDRLKEDAAEAVSQLKKAGKKCIIVSGDDCNITEDVAREVGADLAFGECLPEDKVKKVIELKQKGITAFVGDGVNDAPVLTAADTGFAMGALGSDAAIEAADVVIMDDAPSRIALAITSAQRILKVANQNIRGAIGVKVLTLILGAFGLANMWMAIFADTGVAMLCVMNSMRLLRIARNAE